MMDLHFDPVVLKLIGILEALPGGSDIDIFWGYDFVTGALMHTLGRTGRNRPAFRRCLPKSEDFAAVKERLASFMAAGFIALCGKSSRKTLLPFGSIALSTGRTVCSFNSCVNER